jgi:hypothetical protein
MVQDVLEKNDVDNSIYDDTRADDLSPESKADTYFEKMALYRERTPPPVRKRLVH